MVVAALGASGCSRDMAQPPVSETHASAPAAPTPSDPGPLPPPQALSDVIARLADPAVPGGDKLALVENTTPPDAAALDSFATALRDNGFVPVAVRADDIVPSGPGAVVALITVTGPDSDSARDGEFAFPMEFKRVGNGWQLSRQTADMLLAFGNARTATPVAPPGAAPPLTPSPAPPR